MLSCANDGGVGDTSTLFNTVQHCPSCPSLFISLTSRHTSGVEESVEARVSGLSTKVAGALGEQLDTRFQALYDTLESTVRRRGRGPP